MSIEQNYKKDFNEWLIFENLFPNLGKQGLVGLVKNKKTNEIYVFKISKYINYLIDHEYIVMKNLNEISLYCPHFSKTIGKLTTDTNPYIKKTGNPFDITQIKHSIEKEVLLCEYIDKSYKFYNYIRTEKIEEKILYSTIKQVLLSLSIAQKKKNFTHYDLHSNNIMMKKCDENLVFLYVIDNENQFAVPTYGHYPVIIDFGFSYIKELDGGPLFPSMAHTNVGFTSDRFDWVADPKLFLVTVSKEILNKRNTSTSKKLRRIVKNIFYPLTIEWDSGWDNITKLSSLDHILKIINKYTYNSLIFTEYIMFSIDILQTLVIMPIQKQDYTDIHIPYRAFMEEWKKIETKISCPFYNLYILKNVIDIVRYLRPFYIKNKHTQDIIQEFKERILNSINQVAKFCVIKDINYEKMLCSLVVLSKKIEGYLYHHTKHIVEKKQKEYKKMPINSIDKIYAIISTNIKDKYIYTENTKICIINSIEKTNTMFKLPTNTLETINKLHTITQGTYIYDIYKNNN